MPIRGTNRPTKTETAAAVEVQKPLPSQTKPAQRGQAQAMVNSGHPATRQIILPEPDVSIEELNELEANAVTLEEGGYESFLPTVKPESLAKSGQPFYLTGATLKVGDEALKHGDCAVIDCLFGNGSHPDLKGRAFSLIMSLTGQREKMARTLIETGKRIGPVVLELIPTTKGNPFTNFRPWNGRKSDITTLEVNDLQAEDMESGDSPFAADNQMP